MSLINFPVLVDTFPTINPATDNLNTTGETHSGQHNKATQAIVQLEKITAGPTYVNLRGQGGVGNGSTDDSAAITATLAAAPSGAIIRVPAGEYMMNPATLALLAKAHIWGDGCDTSWFTLISNTAGAAMSIDINVAGGVRTNYGARVKGIGLNLGNAPSALGILVGNSGGAGSHSNWCWLDDIRVEGGVTSFDCQSVNTKVTNFHFINPSTSFVRALSTGLELRLREGVCEVGPSHTVAKAFDFSVPSGGPWGAVYMHDVELNNTGTVTQCMVVACPNGSTASVPVRCINVTLDNLAGPGYDLQNVTDFQAIGGWINAAAGTTNGAVRIYGGGSHTFMGIEQMNGGSSGGCSYDFAGGSTVGVTSIGNTPVTGPIYRLPGSGKPTELLLFDRITSAAGPGNITNDLAGLQSAMSPLWTPPVICRPPFYNGAGTAPITGRATLVAGTVTVNTTAADSTISDWELTRRVLSGTPGHLYISSVNNGVSFTISSTSNTDTSTISWVMHV